MNSPSYSFDYFEDLVLQDHVILHDKKPAKKLSCHFYNITLDCTKNKCPKTVACESGNPLCYSIWKNTISTRGEVESVLIAKNCWPENLGCIITPECNIWKRIHSIRKNENHRFDLFSCCCDSDKCNKDKNLNITDFYNALGKFRLF